MSNAAVAPGRSKLFSPDFVLCCLSFFAFYFSYYLLMPVLPLYIVRVGGSESEVGLIVGSFMISSLSVRLLIGRAVDAHAKRVFLIAGSSLFVASAMLYHLANTTPLLLALRLVHGVGLGIFVTAVYALVADLVPATRRGEAMGFFGMGSSVAMSLGPATGVALLERADFGTVFVGAAMMAFVALSLIVCVKSARCTPPPVHSLSTAFLSREAILPSVLAMILVFAYGGLVSFLPLYVLRNGLGNPGLFFTAYALSIVVARTAGGKLSDRVGRDTVLLPGFAVAAIGLGVLMGARSIEAMVVAALIYGTGFGSVVPVLLAMVADRTREGQRGVGMSMIGGAFDLGNGVGGMILGVVLQFAGFDGMFIASIGVTAAGLAVVLLDRRSARAPKGAMLV